MCIQPQCSSDKLWPDKCTVHVCFITVLFLGGVVGVSGQFPNWQIAAYAMYPLSLSTSTENRKNQSVYSPVNSTDMLI